MKILALALPLVAANLAAPADSYSQNPNWSPWYGCWQAEGAPAGELVCITPVDGGVRVATLIDGAVRDESRIVADAVSRPVQSVGCNGSEHAQWSNDRRRVFLQSDVACGSSARRVVRGMFAFVAPDEWISVQSATEGDSVATRSVRFTGVAARDVPASVASFTARPAFSDALLDVDEADVNEAVAQIGADAAQEWMRSAGEPFELAYQGQGRGHGSALEQVGRLSNPVTVREVVRIVERPVYVHDHHYYDHYRWHYSPWGYRYYGWSWHRPVVYVRFPIVVFRNSHYRRDYWRYDRDRYGRYDYDRHRRDRYDNDRYDRDRDDSRGRVTRAGYSSGRDRSEPNRARTEPQRIEPQRVEPRRVEPQRFEPRRAEPRSSSAPSVSQSSGRTSRASSPARSSSGSSRGAVTRTARPRGSQD